MTLYALDDIDDALDATRSFLWPFDLGRWAKLALVVLFVGAFGGSNPLQFGSGSSGGDVPDAPAGPAFPDGLPAIGGPELAVIGGIVGVIVLLGVAFALIGAVMEFVFVESLRREAVTIRRYWSEHWGRGLRLFGFRLLLGILTFGLIGLLIVAVLGPVMFGDGTISFGLVGLAIPIALVLLIVSGLVHGFTTMFVVPVMMLEERGLVSAWRRFWPTMAGQWKQYAAYAVMGFILQIAGGILAGIVTGIGAVVLAIPLVIVGLLGAGLLTISEVAGWLVIGLVVVLFVLAVIVLALFVSVPVQAYLRYFALLVLGDTNEAFDVIPEQRRAIRA